MAFISTDEIKKRKGAKRGKTSFRYLALSYSRVGVQNKTNKQFKYDGRICLYFTEELLQKMRWMKGNKLQLQFDVVSKALFLKKLEATSTDGSTITGGGRRFTVTYPYYAGSEMPYPKQLIVIDERTLHIKKEGLLIDVSKVSSEFLEFI